MRARNRAFTLIELLVALAIIAVLSGLVLTTVRSLRHKSDLVESAGRLQQWGTALGLFTGENDGALPRRGQGVQAVSRTDRPEDWFNALPPYLGSPTYQDLIKSGRRPKAGEHSIFVSPGTPDPGGTCFFSFAMNMNLSPWNLTDPSRLSQIANFPFVVFMAEAPGPYASVYPSRQAFSVTAPHGGRGAVLFLDGHVGTFTAAELGCKTGDPNNPNVRWLTGTASDSQAPTYQ